MTIEDHWEEIRIPRHTHSSPSEAWQGLLFLRHPWDPLRWQEACSLGDGAVMRLFARRPFPALPAFALHGRGRQFSAPQLPNRFLADRTKAGTGRESEGVSGREQPRMPTPSGATSLSGSGPRGTVCPLRSGFSLRQAPASGFWSQNNTLPTC